MLVRTQLNMAGETHNPADWSPFHYTLILSAQPSIKFSSSFPFPILVGNTFLLSLQPSNMIFYLLILADDLIFYISEKTDTIIKESPQATISTSILSPPTSIWAVRSAFSPVLCTNHL